MNAEAARKADIFAGPPCGRCGGATRLQSIESHRRRKRSHVWTFECMACGAIEKLDMPIPQKPN